MKAHLMYPQADFDLTRPAPMHADELVQDLALDTLFDALADDDKFLRQVARCVLLTGFDCTQEIVRYRQAVLRDCLANQTVVRDLYQLALDVLGLEKDVYLSFMTKYPSSIMHRSLKLLHLQIDLLRRLRRIADDQAEHFASDGFGKLFGLIQEEINDQYFAELNEHFEQLKLRKGFLISAHLGPLNRGMDYCLRRYPRPQGNWLQRLMQKKPESYVYELSERDETGATALSELEDRGANEVANALAQAAEHITGFFEMLRTELAFYIGCLNLRERLSELRGEICFPDVAPAGQYQEDFEGLYDICLALNMQRAVVGNDLPGDGCRLFVVTGANQGGKSTFLRSIGIAQVMLQCGLFVPAKRLRANLCDGLYTHYKREEDTSMKRGKLDEELARMSDIVDHLSPRSLLLCNESFAATNEREGSEIARQVVRALAETGVKTVFVTHLHDFAESLYRDPPEGSLFLRAERKDDGGRTFRIIEGEPLATAFGTDLYVQVFGEVA
ncbi:DNA mismatch repair protein MutS [Pseudomonas aeruginosa]|uniref:MutS-related protein n=1 Tax=Pseudomonas aeruginosa TaxID=287 RepID=UPI003748563F|nr:DNA mismatch repair protein MutS [Pseudomonas aeruginosa]HBP6060980.1 DNA mismatch repair protein MutS [Pseudomonas aeruginosa]HBP6170170.1 DNA mismatch repair protein MutS [Pseudomonas aeruginosa]HBP6483605.1 DNA mismatch repair protein MutS [Pseudomonas aeruginosa]